MGQRRGLVLPLRPRGRRSLASLRILILSGPNLQLLGTREVSVYGTTTLDEIHQKLGEVAERHGINIETRQSNHEGDLVSWIGEAAQGGFHGVVLNAGAYTHTSVALLDAVKGVAVPVVEVHLSNPEARERFRRRSLLGRACIGRVTGFGPSSYELGLLGLLNHLQGAPEPSRREASVRPLPKPRLQPRTTPARKPPTRVLRPAPGPAARPALAAGLRAGAWPRSIRPLDDESDPRGASAPD